MPDDIYYDEPTAEEAYAIDNNTEPIVVGSKSVATDTKASFMRRIITVQRKLKAPKNSYNSFGKYFYRNCEDILEGVKPLLEEHELLLMLNDEVVTIGDRYYIKATATLCDMLSAESVSTTAYAREPESKKGSDQSQVTGSSSTYARKYALSGLLLLDDNKDADTPQGQQKPKEPPAQGPFIARCESCGTQYQFQDANQYKQFIANPQCCQNPHWVVV